MRSAAIWPSSSAMGRNDTAELLKIIADERDDRIPAAARFRRLEEIPGVGPIVATSLVAEVGDWKVFSSGRSLAA